MTLPRLVTEVVTEFMVVVEVVVVVVVHGGGLGRLFKVGATTVFRLSISVCLIITLHNTVLSS